jgi:thiol-disulfide isomerase/thioredoxin
MRPWFTLGAALVAAGIGFWAWQAKQTAQPTTAQAPQPPVVAADAVVKPVAELDRLPALHYMDLDGRQRSTREWQGKVLVLNFWASWCPPCREETPLFVQLQEEYKAKGVQFVGLAIDDKEPVQNFVDTYGVDYPILLGDIGAVDLSKRLGNRFGGLPYTVIVAPDGQIVLRHAGGFKREQLEPLLQRLVSG